VSDEKEFRIKISSSELKERLLKRVSFHEARMKHYMKREAKALKEELKTKKAAMERDQQQVEDLQLALAQERSSYGGISGFSGVSSLEYKHRITSGISDKFMNHERNARRLKFIADHLKEEDYELDQSELDRLELV
jgi:hypothetical protein